MTTPLKESVSVWDNSNRATKPNANSDVIDCIRLLFVDDDDDYREAVDAELVDHGFSVESFFDEVAHVGGKDPYELRRTLLANQPRMSAVLNLVAEKAGWGKPDRVPGNSEVGRWKAMWPRRACRGRPSRNFR